jgi:hypothetical protein
MNLNDEYRQIVKLIGNLALIPQVLEELRGLKKGGDPSDEWTENFLEKVKGVFTMQLDDLIASVSASIDAISAGLTGLGTDMNAGFSNLEAQIAALKAAGVDTSAIDKAVSELKPVADKLAAVQAQVETLDSAAKAVVAPAPAPTPVVNPPTP